MMNTFIAVDIGGTRIRVGVYPEDGIIPIAQKRISTRGEGSAVDRMIGLISELWPQNHNVCGLAVGAPGAIDPFEGIVYFAPNVPEWHDIPLKKILADRFSVPTALGNDANLAALGEWKYGAGQGHNDLIYVTISTGIGSGIIVGGKLLVGSHGLGAEIGHTTVMDDGPMCGCGHPGHLEAVSSGTGISRYFAEQLALGRPSRLQSSPTPSAKEIVAAARDGDALALEVVTRAGTYLGIGMANLLHLFNPSLLIFGGGVSQAGDMLWQPMKKSLSERILAPQYLENLEFRRAALGDDTGLLGALVLARTLASG